jgi:hypothetical protein
MIRVNLPSTSSRGKTFSKKYAIKIAISRMAIKWGLQAENFRKNESEDARGGGAKEQRVWNAEGMPELGSNEESSAVRASGRERDEAYGPFPVLLVLLELNEFTESL